MVAELVVVNQNMVFDAETLAQLLEVVGATAAAAIATHEDSGGSRHDSSGRRGASPEKGYKRVKDFGWPQPPSKSRSRPQVFQLVTKMERAESEDAMMEIATRKPRR